MASLVARHFKADTVDQVGMGLVLEILAAVCKLAARRVEEEQLGVGAERVFRVVCLNHASQY